MHLTDERERILELQRMLNEVASGWHENALRVPVSGVYNEETSRAVRLFQARESLPETGVCDRRTWEGLVHDCDRLKEEKAPILLRISPHEWLPVCEKEENAPRDAVMLLQIMLRALSASYAFPPVPLDGICGAATRGAVTAFQRTAGLPETGIPDAPTLRKLAEAYNRGDTP